MHSTLVAKILSISFVAVLTSANATLGQTSENCVHNERFLAGDFDPTDTACSSKLAASLKYCNADLARNEWYQIGATEAEFGRVFPLMLPEEDREVIVFADSARLLLIDQVDANSQASLLFLLYSRLLETRISKVAGKDFHGIFHPRSSPVNSDPEYILGRVNLVSAISCAVTCGNSDIDAVQLLKSEVFQNCMDGQSKER